MKSIVPEVGSVPTFLSLGAAAGRLDGAGADEADIVFFHPPRADEPLSGRARTVRDADSRRLDRTVEYFDSIGRRVAEVYLSGVHPAGAEDAPGGFEQAVGELARCVVDRFGAANVRRFRVRITGSADGEATNCTVAELQHYRTDHESVQDVAVVCATASGTVIARAWVTVAVPAQPQVAVDGVPA